MKCFLPIVMVILGRRKMQNLHVPDVFNINLHVNDNQRHFYLPALYLCHIYPYTAPSYLNSLLNIITEGKVEIPPFDTAADLKLWI